MNLVLINLWIGNNTSATTTPKENQNDMMVPLHGLRQLHQNEDNNNSTIKIDHAITTTSPDLEENHISTKNEKETVVENENNPATITNQTKEVIQGVNKDKNYQNDTATTIATAAPTTTQTQKSPAPTIPFATNQHFFLHIPKTAGTHAFIELNRLSKDYWVNATDIMAVCNIGRGNFITRPADFKGKQCQSYMSERSYSNIPSTAGKVYTILRNPKEHVVSQYFHCMESKDHAHKRGFMRNATLDEWMQDFVKNILEISYENNQTARMLLAKQKYQCYDPINLQLKYLEMNYNFYNSTIIMNKTTIKEELRGKFEIIGDQSQMKKTICAMFISFTKVVPDECVCSQQNNRRLGSFASSDHGVIHHGATYQPTSVQKILISKLTRLDQILYECAQEVFQEQVENIEERYQIQLCNK